MKATAVASVKCFAGGACFGGVLLYGWIWWRERQAAGVECDEGHLTRLDAVGERLDLLSGQMQSQSAMLGKAVEDLSKANRQLGDTLAKQSAVADDAVLWQRSMRA